MISLFNEKVFWIKEETYAHSGNCSSEKFIIFNFWFLFVTKNGILRFSSFGVTKWQWIKNSKWNHPKLGDCGFKKQIGYNFWPLFVTKNCILQGADNGSKNLAVIIFACQNSTLACQKYTFALKKSSETTFVIDFVLLFFQP